jgi:hypothetical protein
MRKRLKRLRVEPVKRSPCHVERSDTSFDHHFSALPEELSEILRSVQNDMMFTAALTL